MNLEREFFRIRNLRALAIGLFLTSLVAQGQFTYTTNNGTITITGYTGPGGAVIIPDTTNGLPVTGIGNYAFRENYSLTGVLIPSSVVFIGGGSFQNCTNLTVVGLTNGLTTIASGAFRACSRLTSITIPTSVGYIAASAFASCTGITNATIPNGVAIIGNSAFYGCVGLTTVSLPASVTNLGAGVFGTCFNMPAIAVDPSNPVYRSSGGVVFNTDLTTLVEFPSGYTGTYLVPPSVKSIASFGFAYSGGINVDATASGITNVTDHAFWASGVRSVALPDTVVSVGDDAFFTCFSLTNVQVGNKVSSIGLGAFDKCNNLASITFPASVVSIGMNAFDSCTNLQALFFLGNQPNPGSYTVFGNAKAVVYYMPGTTGWGPTFIGLPTMLWNPQASTTDGSFGVRNNQFGFTITGTANIPLVVEASTDLASSGWVPLQTCTLTNGLVYFSDPDWTNHPQRFYRVNWPRN